MAQFDLFLPPKRRWNTGRIIGPKSPFKPRHIWGIRRQLKANGRVLDMVAARDHRAFETAIPSGIIKSAAVLVGR
jgi:hypothetical protein